MTESERPRGSLPAPLSWGALLEAHPLAHFVYDTVSLQLLAANEAALQRYGCTREEFVTLNRADLLLPSELPKLRTFLANLPASALAEPQPVWLERTRDGRVLHADVRGMPVLFEGRPARLAAVVDAGMRARLAADAAGARDLLAVAGRMAQLGGWRIDLKARRTQWSEQVCAIHEVPVGTEYDLDAAVAFYSGEAAATIEAAVRACTAQGTPFDLELPFVGARGTQRWVRVVGAAVRDGDGQVVAIEGAQQDITERKQAALQLAESRSRLAALVEALPDLWIVLDARHCYAEVSNAAHPALGAPWETMLGRSIDELLPPTLARATRRLMGQARRSGRPQSYHYEMDTLGGERRSFEGRCVGLSQGRSLMLIRDITESVQLEQRFQAMADAAPVGIYMTDALGACTYTNPAWQALYGLSAEASLGHAWASMVRPDDRKRIYATWSAAAAAGQPCEMEFQLVLGDGSERVVWARSSPVPRADGSIAAHVGTVVDVTHARELAAARQAQAVAEEAGRRQAAFMSRVSHELRTPLNAILGFGQLLQQAPRVDQARTEVYASHVVGAGRHMLALVDDLLELQKLEHDREPAVSAPVDVAMLMQACAELLRPAAAAADIELVLSVAPGLAVDSDERRLRQIVLNLGSNAVKYGRAPGGASRVVLAAEQAADGLHLSVVDHGRGIAPEQLERLFRPFERLGQETGSQPGSGLGLVIARQMAQRLGGEVTLVSTPGVGTTATLRLPLRPLAPVASDRVA